MADTETLRAYDKHSQDYLKLDTTDEPRESLKRFIARLPAGGHVLDWGCGPANASAHMRAAGLRPHPVDASAAMVEIANARHDIGAKQAEFRDLAEHARYDGIWASFSLLHAKRSELPSLIEAAFAALRPNGWLHIAMKLGQGARRDRLGRFYTYVAEQELEDMLTRAGFTLYWRNFGEETGLAGDLDPFIQIQGQRDG